MSEKQYFEINPALLKDWNYKIEILPVEKWCSICREISEKELEKYA